MRRWKMVGWTRLQDGAMKLSSTLNDDRIVIEQEDSRVGT